MITEPLMWVLAMVSFFSLITDVLIERWFGNSLLPDFEIPCWYSQEREGERERERERRETVAVEYLLAVEVFLNIANDYDERKERERDDTRIHVVVFQYNLEYLKICKTGFTQRSNWEDCTTVRIH